MKPDWKRFLKNRGAEVEDGRVLSFGNPVREAKVVTTGNILADLSHLGLISVHGEDAVTFLQGQCTNDVQHVNPERSQLNAICSPKGRMLASFRLFQRDDTLYMHMPRTMIEGVLKRLRMYVLRAKVKLEDASDALVGIGYSGPSAEDELRQQFHTIPSAIDAVVQVRDITLIRVPGLHPRFEIYGEYEAIEKLWTALDVRGAPVGEAAWTLLDIKCGIPVIQPQTADAFVPQMVNFEAVGGVSFKKGCYTGQEIVARMQYLGKLKRRMFRAQVEAPAQPEPNTDVYAAGSDNTQSVGRVVQARPVPDDGYELLVVVDIASQARHEIRLGALDGPALRFDHLPYTLADDTADDTVKADR